MIVLIFLGNSSCRKEDDASIYFYPCSRKATYTYNGYKDGEKTYEKKLVYKECNCKNNNCSLIFDEEINYLNGSDKQYNKKEYIISKKMVKTISTSSSSNSISDIIISAPIKEGNEWEFNNNDKFNTHCKITKIYNSQTIFDPNICIIVLCNETAYDYCENTGLETVSKNGKFLEIIKKIDYKY